MKLRSSFCIAAFAAVTSTAAFAADNQFVDNSTVRQVQQTLKNRGSPIAIDGIMGPRTQAAIREFQRSENLEPTGQLNRQTLVALGIQQADAVAGASQQYSQETIRQVQQTLNNRGFKAGPRDGALNANTRMALKEFQKSENLEDTGQLNAQTLNALGISPDAMASAERRDMHTDRRAMRTQGHMHADATVREVQRRLNALGYNAGREDGITGPETRAALTRFQQDENLASHGRLNNQTLAALRLRDTVAIR